MRNYFGFWSSMNFYEAVDVDFHLVDLVAQFSVDIVKTCGSPLGSSWIHLAQGDVVLWEVDGGVTS